MRIDVKKFLFVGVADTKKEFFAKAQEKGIVHFIDSKVGKAEAAPADLQHVTAAIKILRGLPVVEQEEIHEYSLADGIVEKILDLRHRLEKLYEEARILKLEISRVQVFGDFSKDDIRHLEKEAHRHLQFFFAKSGYKDEPNFPEEPLFIGSDHGLDYFVTISKEHLHFEKMVEMKVDRPVGELRTRLKQVEQDTVDVEHTLKTYAKYNYFLHHALIDKMNRYNLTKNEGYVQNEIDDNLFAVQGWVPHDKISELEEVVRAKNVFYDEIAIEDKDVIPTFLENEGMNRVGEDLVHIYDTPSITDKDPSLWVLCFFALFFAFIVGDGGYGLILLCVALYFGYKFKGGKGIGRRMLKLSVVLCTACIIWGFLTTSFLGFSIPYESPLRKVSLLTWMAEKKIEYHQKNNDAVFKEWVTKFPELEKATSPEQVVAIATKVDKGKRVHVLLNDFTDTILMELALLIGIIHLCFSFLRNLKRNKTGIGWVIAIIGGYFYFPYYLGASSAFNFLTGISPQAVGPEGLYMMIGGTVLATVISIYQNRLLGLLEPMTGIQIFADVLSYLRLYALGLAGAIVSATINELAGGLFIVFAVPLILLGHIVNIILAIMGGVIHGLRLNFLEWYRWSFEGGGKMFNPLRKLYHGSDKF